LVLTVKKIVATPLLAVVLVGLENEPPAPVFVQVTTLPATLTALLFVSANCAVTVTVLATTGFVLLEVTMYFAPGPGTVVMLPLALVMLCASVAVMV
jgi:hypothetical protein